MTKVSHTKSFRWRGLIGSLLFIPAAIAVIFSTPMVTEGGLLEWACNACGWFLLVVYATFRIWATLYVGGRKDRVLQTEGIYSATRNPLYFGGACLALAAALFFQSLLLLLLTLVVLAFYSVAVVRSEEDVLRQLFGETFENYSRETPRFFPSFSRYRRPKEVLVNLDAMRREARRLWLAAALPIVAELVSNLRDSPDWPHWFYLL